MSRTVSLHCRCGAVRGEALGITPADDARAVCYCDDCQVFALHLGSPNVLDARGGTDVCLLAPGQVRIGAGSEHVHCVRLSPKGLLRWYSACCNTPIANTPSARVPLVMLVHSFMDHAEGGRTRDEDLGPPASRVMARFAAGGVPQGAHPGIPISIAPGVLKHLARAVFRGTRKPSAFFDDLGQPRRAPTVVDRTVREQLRERVHAAMRA